MQRCPNTGTEPERDPEDNFWNEVYWTLLRSVPAKPLTAFTTVSAAAYRAATAAASFPAYSSTPLGSGKSTLAKHLNALLLPTEGKVLVDGMDTADEADTLSIRQRVGMVFQNPDNQLVTTIVEEDVAFGPENIGVPGNEIRTRNRGRTFNAVTAFQRANRITADGIAGPRTWALLKPYLSGELMTYVVRR